MTLPPRQTRYFVAGGTMRPNVPSYVKRPADSELISKIRDGEFCYVLTPRQMGKSSLMVRSSRQLRELGTHTVTIDLTEIGSVPIDKWYQGLLIRLQRDLKLNIDIKSWWQENDNLGEPQRFHQFITDVVLPTISGDIVIFVDEIDSTLNLDFRDDFFATLRSLFNGRSLDPEMERVTFVLLGVASPSELIEDRFRTPFNIGHEINLQEFNHQDAHALVKGLAATFPEHGQAIFDRIYYWTNGHPYLTQKLCVHITDNPYQNWNDNNIDTLVNQLFLQDEARGETNIQFVSDRILKSPQRADLLKLYKKIYQGKIVADNKQDPDQSQLLLSGLVKIDDGHLVVSNQIYKQAFDKKWIEKETDSNWKNMLGGATLIILSVTIVMLLLEVIFLPVRADVLGSQFHDAYDPEEAPTRAVALVNLLNSSPRIVPAVVNLLGLNPQISSEFENHTKVRELFYDPRNTWDNQSAILNPDHFEDQEDYLRLIENIYFVLADVDNNGNSSRLLRKINEYLERWPNKNENINDLQNEIQAWLDARTEHEMGNYDNAQNKYIEAIEINSDNPATRFELAQVYIFLATQGNEDINYNLALRELDKVVEITFLQEPETGEEWATPSPSFTTPTSIVPGEVLRPTSLPAPLVGSDENTSLPTGEISDSPQQPLATVTSVPLSPTPDTRPVIPNFISRNERTNAVVNLLQNFPKLLLFAQQADITSYTVLRTNGFIPAQSIVEIQPTPTPLDSDSDGLSDEEEFSLGTLPQNGDTDNDGLNDYDEVVILQTDPLRADTDGDTLPDNVELETDCLSPTNPDTDGDELPDNREIDPCAESSPEPILVASATSTSEIPPLEPSTTEPTTTLSQTPRITQTPVPTPTQTPAPTSTQTPAPTIVVVPVITLEPSAEPTTTQTPFGDIFLTTQNRIYSIGINGENPIDHGAVRNSTCGSQAQTALGETFDLFLGPYCGIGDTGTGSCRSPNGQYEVITQAISLSETTVAIRPVGADATSFVFQGRLDRSEGIRWSPTSEQFLFVAGDTVYAASLDGSYSEIIPIAYSPQFSSDGSLILYHKPVGAGILDVFVNDADGSNTRRVTTASFLISPCPRWSGS